MMPSASPYEGGLFCIKSSTSDPAWDCEFMFCLPEELEYNFSVPTNNNTNSNSSNSNSHPSNMAPHFNGGQTANGLTSHQHHQHQQQQQQQPQPVSNGLDDSFLAQMPPLAPLTASTPSSVTASKTIPAFSEQSSPAENDWTKKLPSEWRECDVINWLFDVAKKHNIPGELVMKGNFSSVTGADLLRMSRLEFQEKIPDRGYFLYDELHQLHQSLQSHAPAPSAASTLADTELTQLGLSRDWSMGQLFNLPHNNNHSHHPQHAQHAQTHPQAHPHHNNSNSNAYYHSNPMAEAHVHPEFTELNCYSGQAAPGTVNGGAVPSSGDSNKLFPLHPSSGHDRILYDPTISYQQDQSMDLVDMLESYSGGTPSDQEESYMPETGTAPLKRVGRPAGKSANRRRKTADGRGYGKLWEFIRDLLHKPEYCPSMVRWENVEEGVFRIVKSEDLARLWGNIKNNPRMTYEKLSRAMRYYYKSQVFLPVLGRRLVYKFGPSAVKWRPEDPNFERLNSR